MSFADVTSGTVKKVALEASNKLSINYLQPVRAEMVDSKRMVSAMGHFKSHLDDAHRDAHKHFAARYKEDLGKFIKDSEDVENALTDSLGHDVVIGSVVIRGQMTALKELMTTEKEGFDHGTAQKFESKIQEQLLRFEQKLNTLGQAIKQLATEGLK